MRTEEPRYTLFCYAAPAIDLVTDTSLMCKIICIKVKSVCKRRQNFPQGKDLRMKTKEKTIKGSISRGYIQILTGAVALTLLFTASLVFILVCAKSSLRYGNNQTLASDAMIEANNIYHLVDDKVYSNPSENIDISTPKFNNLYIVSMEEEGSVVNKIKTAKTEYDSFLNVANQIINISSTDNETAKTMIDGLYAELNTLTEELQNVSNSYANMNVQAGSIVKNVITFSIIFGAAFIVILLVVAILISNRMANSVAEPIHAVTEWAEKLSMGGTNIDSSHVEKGKGISQLHEIQRMVQAFTAMSDSIKENVNIVSKVAEGDMTAYVNIRSSEDMLGKSLYKMVQSNDIMFAEITQIADSVTEGTNSIASAAKYLADSCTKQATEIGNFRDDISHTNSLVKENAKDAQQAHELSNMIREEVGQSRDKMQELVAAMKAIYEASAKVSGVINNIESIADQTNLLAINASIEASRAGEAGKSFAVVASSVKNLAEKSGLAAVQTKTLINDTISKATRGSQLSDETNESFESILGTLEQIIEVSQKIADSGIKQQENMSLIEESITEISNLVSANAASSEETAAMTHEITKSTEVLKASMSQFHLRNRTPGKPYIPPEKKNDKEFVRIATANYEKFMASPEGHKMMHELHEHL